MLRASFVVRANLIGSRVGQNIGVFDVDRLGPIARGINDFCIDDYSRRDGWQRRCLSSLSSRRGARCEKHRKAQKQ